VTRRAAAALAAAWLCGTGPLGPAARAAAPAAAADSARAGPAAAPTDSARRPSFLAAWERGLHFGIGASQYAGDGRPRGRVLDFVDSARSEPGAQIAYELGGYLRRRAGPLRFEGQLLLAARGARFEEALFDVQLAGDSIVAYRRVGRSRRTLQTYALEAPVMARLRFAPWPFEPHLVAGAAPTLLVTASVSDEFGFFVFDSGTMRRFGWNWTAGLGTRWPTGFGALLVDLRWVRGARDAFEDGALFAGESEAWMLGVGLEQGAQRPPPPRERGRPR